MPEPQEQTPREKAMAFVHETRASNVVDPKKLADVLEALVGGDSK